MRICFSDTSWNFLWQRHQQLLTRFPANEKILFVEPSFWKALTLRIINFFSHITVPASNGNIKVVSIPLIPFLDKFAVLRKINDAIIVHCVHFFMRLYGLHNPTLIIYNPRFSCVIGKLDEGLVCYEVTDDKPEFESSSEWLKKDHQFLIKKADLITVSANTLYEKISKERNDDVFLISNGVDVSHFQRALENIEIPNDIRDIKNPILGYIGAVGEWFDFTLLEEILKRYPNVSVVLIGWVFKKQRKIIGKLSSSYKNFYFLGRRSYDRLPNYVKAFTVCVIPFRIYELTKAVDPTKLYEYIAAGKPVISSALPELEKYKDVIYWARDHDEFLEFVDKALITRHNISKFLQIAERNDWQDKARQLMNITNCYESTL